MLDFCPFDKWTVHVMEFAWVTVCPLHRCKRHSLALTEQECEHHAPFMSVWKSEATSAAV